MLARRGVPAAVVFLLLAACGGGGGGGGSGSAPPPVPSGAFTLSANSASFAALEGASPPAPATLALTITGSNVGFVGAAYANGQTQPSWLGIDITGSGTSYQVVISIRSTAISPGNYSSTFAVGTADSAGNVLSSQNITVSYALTARVAMSSQTQSYQFIYGDSVTTGAHSISVVAPSRQWAVHSDAYWLSFPAGTQSNNASVSGAIDVSTLTPGQHQARVTVVNTSNAQDTVSETVTVNVAAPTLAVAQDVILLGGEDGLSSAAQSLSFAVQTGSASHPYLVELSTDSNGAWLEATSTTGVVGSGGVTVQLNGDRTALVGGTYTGQVRVTATVRDIVLSEVLPVTFNIEASRLVVSAAGVGLSSSPAPGRSVLTRAVPVYSSIARTDVPWQTTDDAAWLTVTSSGETGDALTLTADPTGLAADTTHFATVTITSPDARVENTETIRVGLHVNSTAPSDLSSAITAQFIAASPVEPLVFINDGGPIVNAYNVYTGALARTFTGVVANAGAMAVKADGRSLFVYDRTNLRVTELNAVSGALVRHYAASISGGSAAGGVLHFRPDGHSILVTPSGRVYNAESGAEYVGSEMQAAVSSLAFAPSFDHRHLTTHGGSVYRSKRTALAGGSLQSQFVMNPGTAGGRDGQACIGSDNATVYTASGAPYDFRGTNIFTQQLTRILPGTNYPNSMLCLWNGLLIGGVDGYYSTSDVWIYDGANGQELARRSSSAAADYRSLLDRGMAASADAMRLVTLTEGEFNWTDGRYHALEVRFQSLPGPL